MAENSRSISVIYLGKVLLIILKDNRHKITTCIYPHWRIGQYIKKTN